MKTLNERRADNTDRIATGLAIAAFVADVSVWARFLLIVWALVLFVLGEGFARQEKGDNR